ncbi:hypothetical protein [Flavobacterium suncheonense]|uniref:hypothetical protein n=1 Tax=Flavobacterium suncheonense TaxID=350894 RepID=UPI00040AD47A|nr:hypothetical protein [Flavobacterium suncheonense]
MRNTFLKRTFYTVLALTVMLGFSECSHHHHHHHHKTVKVKKKRLPPGHAKKIHGDKSARKHARGHNK